MKHFTLFLLGIFFVSIVSAQVITVDNFNSGAQYADLQTAINAANTGDTIYVAGSNNSYGNIAISGKTLTLFGRGYLTELDDFPTEIGIVSFRNNSKKSAISGFKMTKFSLDAGVTNMDSINISDNLITGTSVVYGWNDIINGTVIEGNIFTNPSASIANIDFRSSYIVGKQTVRNNIFYGFITEIYDAASVIENNIFIQGGSGDLGFLDCQNASVSSNIFFGTSEPSNATGGECFNCALDNNLEYYHDGTNYVGVNPLFVNPDTLATNNITAFDIGYDFALQAGSPAIGAGAYGTDAGAYGGFAPFVFGGYAPIPRITSFTSPNSVIQEGGTIEITIQAESKQ